MEKITCIKDVGSIKAGEEYEVEDKVGEYIFLKGDWNQYHISNFTPPKEGIKEQR